MNTQRKEPVMTFGLWIRGHGHEVLIRIVVYNSKTVNSCSDHCGQCIRHAIVAFGYTSVHVWKVSIEQFQCRVQPALPLIWWALLFVCLWDNRIANVNLIIVCLPSDSQSTANRCLWSSQRSRRPYCSRGITWHWDDVIYHRRVLASDDVIMSAAN